MSHTTWIEINKTALDKNIQQYRSWLAPQTGIAAVVKANAYGHGLIEVGQIVEQNADIIRLCTANTHEAVKLRMHGIKKPILVLGFIDTPLSTIVEHSLDLIVSDLEMINQLNAVGKLYNKKINVHVKVDTGLSRLGFLPSDVSFALDTIRNAQHLNLQGICSHFIEAASPVLVHKQEDILQQFWHPDLQIHIANSNSALHTKYSNYSFARIGAGLYGYLPEAQLDKQQLLHPIIALKTKIINLKQVPTGVSVGYGSTTHITQRPTTIATLGMGYYEGMDPDLMHFGKVLIHDQYAPIIGRINMNYFMVDVTHIPQAQKYDTVTVLGQDTNKYITPYDWRIGAKKNVRIFTARLSNDIAREVVEQPVISIHETIMQPEHIMNIS